MTIQPTCPICQSPLTVEQLDNEVVCILNSHGKTQWRIAMKAAPIKRKKEDALHYGEPCKTCGKPKHDITQKRATQTFAYCAACRTKWAKQRNQTHEPWTMKPQQSAMQRNDLLSTSLTW